MIDDLSIRNAFAAMVFLSVSPQAALAQSEPCWQIVSPTQNVAPEALVLLNKCNGKTWILGRLYIVDSKGKRTGEWMYRWSPLQSNDNEPVFSMPKLPVQ